jgi:hypothetical protein
MSRICAGQSIYCLLHLPMGPVRVNGKQGLTAFFGLDRSFLWSSHMSNARPWSSLRTFTQLTQLMRLHFTVRLSLVGETCRGFRGPRRGRTEYQLHAHIDGDCRRRKQGNTMKFVTPALRVAAALLLSPALAIAQSWQPTTNTAPVYAGSSYLMTDGTVLVQNSGAGSWVKLTPDQFGSYVNGTWSVVASMPTGYGPLYFASAVLPDGRLVVIGGEYNNGVSADTNLGAIYDPKSNTWTPLAAPAGWGSIGDAPSVVLPNGKFLLGNAFSAQLALLDPATLTWTAASSTGKSDSNNEEGFTLLPDGSVLDVNVDSAPATLRYLPSLGEWITAGNTPVSLSEYLEMGPAILRPDGTVFQVGASGANAVYTPPSTPDGYRHMDCGSQLSDHRPRPTGRRGRPGLPAAGRQCAGGGQPGRLQLAHQLLRVRRHQPESGPGGARRVGRFRPTSDG